MKNSQKVPKHRKGGYYVKVSDDIEIKISGYILKKPNVRRNVEQSHSAKNCKRGTLWGLNIHCVAKYQKIRLLCRANGTMPHNSLNTFVVPFGWYILCLRHVLSELQTNYVIFALV